MISKACKGGQGWTLCGGWSIPGAHSSRGHDVKIKAAVTSLMLSNNYNIHSIGINLKWLYIFFNLSKDISNIADLRSVRILRIPLGFSTRAWRVVDIE